MNNLAAIFSGEDLSGLGDGVHQHHRVYHAYLAEGSLLANSLWGAQQKGILRQPEVQIGNSGLECNLSSPYGGGNENTSVPFCGTGAAFCQPPDRYPSPETHRKAEQAYKALELR